MRNLMNRKKDGGFTLIELMIVIAVIGILAVVLVPRFGAVRTDAKSAGVETNMHSVELYVQSNIETWKSDATADTAAVITKITTNVAGIANPFGNTGAVLAGTTSGTPVVVGPETGNPVVGAVYVAVSGSGSSYSVTISGYGTAATPVRTVTVTP